MLLSFFFLGIFTHCPIKVKCLLIMYHICVMNVVGKKFLLSDIKMPSPTCNTALEKLDPIILAGQVGIIMPLTY